MKQEAQKPFVLDRELVGILGNIPGLGVQFFRKDRLGAQLIPFHKVGRTCLYDPAEVIEAIRNLRVGGKAEPKQRKHAGAQAVA